MATKKKKARTRRKPLKQPVTEQDSGPTELEGWKVGDIPWAVPFGSNKPVQLTIQRLNPKDKIPSLSCYDLINRRYCVVATSWCADNKIKAKQLYLSRSKEDN